MQSGIFLLRYRTEMTDAGMPMPALVFRMPMPNYANSKRQEASNDSNENDNMQTEAKAEDQTSAAENDSSRFIHSTIAEIIPKLAPEDAEKLKGCTTWTCC
jgi:hypothetical protein